MDDVAALGRRRLETLGGAEPSTRDNVTVSLPSTPAAALSPSPSPSRGRCSADIADSFWEQDLEPFGMTSEEGAPPESDTGTPPDQSKHFGKRDADV